MKYGKFDLNIFKTPFLLQGWWDIGTGAPRGCGVSILGDTQNSIGRGL